MFEAIGTLITIVIWLVAIFLFGGGLLICIGNLIGGGGFEKFMAVLGIILGIVAFSCIYSWFESIVWCLMGSGIVLGLIGNAGSDSEEKAPKKEEKYGFGKALVDTYCEYELTKAAVKDAIKESKE